MNSIDFVGEANKQFDSLKALRRTLHQMPEFGLEVPNTLALLLESVSGLGDVFLGKNMTAAALVIKGSQPGPTVLIRTDMDALAVIEDTGLEFSSTNGYMHACGHDLHMAMVVGAARLIHQHRDKLIGDVVVWFQPGEEGHGGADIMLEQDLHLVSGSMPIAAYGLHVFSSYPKGMFGARAGALMASAGGFTATFTGSGGHGSMPWLSKDPITPMAEAISNIQGALNKRLDAFDPAVVNVGWVKAGDDHTENVIPETASFGATVRTFSAENSSKLKEVVGDVLNGIAAAYGVKVSVEWHPATKVLMNEAKAVDRSRKLISEMFGPERYYEMPTPMAGGEDFASVLDVMPGAFIFMGACVDGVNPATAPTNHSNRAVFDDSVIPSGTAFLAALTFDTLDEAAQQK